ncbi:MAG: DUF2029 domain-containing protein [Deltaproteobacteria bacterium]|nr:DUF2029 domain-containing protein [Deltaproteobacteria bacterium]
MPEQLMKCFSTRSRLWILGLLSAFVYVVNFNSGDFLSRLGILSASPSAFVSYLIQLFPLTLFYILALWVVGRAGDDNAKGLLAVTLLFALVFRLPLILQEPVLSSDLYRYLWDGRVQVVGGLNPYLYSAGDDKLASLRDQEIFPQINRKEAPTVYPAGAQLLFRGLHRLGIETPGKFKAAALVADGITMGILFLILIELRLPRSRILIYGWNPLIIYELFHSGHLESFLLPPLMAFVYLLLRNRLIGAGALLGVAAAIKLIPALLLVAIPPGKRIKILLAFLFVFIFSYLPYVGAGKKVLGFLPKYFSDPYEIFNPGILQAGLLWGAKSFALPPSSIRYVLSLILIAFLLFIMRRHNEQPEQLIPRLYIIFVLCLIPSRAWLYLSLVLPLSYLKYLNPDAAMPPWITAVQFAPLYVLLAFEYARMKPLNERRYQWHLGTQTPSSTTL